ncbi:MAG: ABC transporter permease [Chromatiales bacterium]|jgi:ABC-2 type transport system permease protein|nr:ABC transporter permease [Chromatiales bacterium]
MSLRQQAVALATLSRKEYDRVIRIWGQTILPPAINMGLYFLIFGNLIGSRIGTMGGFDYKQYIAPGLIMMAVITNSYGNVVSSFFSAKINRHLEEMLVAPMADSAIVLGHMAGGIIRGSLVGLTVTAVAFLFTPLPMVHPFITVSVFLLCAALFSLGGLINGILAKNFDDVSIIPSFVLTPLTYLGGVFYSITLLPDFAQQLSRLNPILYIVNAFRYGMLGVSDIDIGVAYAVMLGAIAVLFGTCLVLIRLGVRIRE